METTSGQPPRRRSRRRAQDAWLRAEIAVEVAVFFCPLAIATVHGWSIATAAALALLACGLATWATLRSGEAFLLPGPSVVFAAVTLLIAFQLVPLPPAVLGRLAPYTRSLFETTLGPLGHYPAWRPLSLDPPATALELAKAITYLAIFLAAAQLTRSRRARRRVVTAIGLAGLAVALIGFGHALWGATTLFGLFRYGEANPPFFSTFGNPNHLSSFLTLAATALLARVLLERDRKVATLWGFAYLAAGVGVLLTLSRGGIVAFVAGQVMLGLAVHQSRRSEREGVRIPLRSLVVPAAVLLVLAVSAYLAWEAIAQELASADSLDKLRDSKLALWPTFVPLLREHWLMGVGRGAFQVAYQRFQDGSLHATFTNPENLFFQWTLEIGLPMGLLLLGACAWAVIGCVRRDLADIERLACAVALTAIGFHELVDFGLEVGGLAVPASVALAIAVARGDNGPRLKRRVALGVVPALAVVAALALLRGQATLEDDGKAIAEELGPRPADEVAAHAAALAARHPADYFPHLVAAQAYALERPYRPERLMPWAARAMQLNPIEPLPHRLAAQALRAIKRPAQARLEYRLAYALGDRGVLEEVIAAFPDPMEMADAVPATELALTHLADALLGFKRYADAEAVVRTSVERHGEGLPSLRRLARIDAERGAADALLAVGTRMSEVAPADAAGLHARVQALQMKGDPQAAIRLLQDEGTKRFPLDAEVMLSLASLHLSTGDTRACREVLKKLPAGLDVGIRVRALLIEAGAAERDGQGSKALGLVRSAVTLRPSDGWLRWQYATSLERVGRLDAAIREAEAAAGQVPRLRGEADKLRARAEARKKELEQLRRWQDVEAAEGSKDSE